MLLNYNFVVKFHTQSTYTLQTERLFYLLHNIDLSHDVASESDITPCNLICKPLMVY